MKKSNCLYRNKKYVLMFLRPFGSKRAELERLCLKDVLSPIGIKNMFLCSYV